ncbi:MAG: hypothetical protein AB8G14_08245 [Ilumatobacter sp.]
MNEQDGSRSGGINLATREDDRLRELLIERLTAREHATAATTAADEPLLSVEPVTRFARITAAALRRRPIVAAALFATIALCVAMLLAGSPAQYQTTATVLLAGDSSLGGTEGTTSSAAEQAESVILSRENLDAMVTSLELVENEAPTPVLGRLRQRIGNTIFGEESFADRTREIRDQLALSIFVTNDADANVAITVVWPDPDQAVAIANASYESFVQSRRSLEVEPLRESVALLTGRAGEASAVVDRIRAELNLSPGDGASAGSELEGVVRAEQDLLEQLRIAEVRLDEAEAGVTVRYALLTAPERPDTPISGNLTGYLYAIVLAGCVTAGVFYFRSRPKGRIAHTWQLDDMGVAVLGVVNAQNKSLW